ncbi:tyrosine-type recombinase/integrase [Nocardia cyriacigeorgica]|uniref:tyrosine-type recombinase/integrase n=1 Tax=Nocardia cyriacigeorgica TaxID=135487 RepID=UPI0024570D36|nr:tyrosine-type recombinase/integrase [Nocardia cyriacigeorgica]
MAERIDVPGAAHLVLADGVAHLDPAAAVHEAMLEGWARQQRVRFLKADTIAKRVRLVPRVVEFSNLYPWRWNYAELEAFIDSLRNRTNPIEMSTGRAYLVELRLFLEYASDIRYGWTGICLDRFGEAPRQVLGEWNMVAHVSDYEGRPGRRPLTYDEVQALFDAADSRVAAIRARGRKGSLAALRDATLLKTVYAYGLRRREAWGLDLPDLRHNPKAPQFGRVGALFVRWGKSSKGSPPKRRTVLTVPEMDWIVDALEYWIEEVRPFLAPGKHPALWVTERCGRLSKRGINEAFEQARIDAGLPKELDLHSLRHSYVTHLIEFDYPERFVSEQVGHAYAATTAIYTGVSDDYRNRLLTKAFRAQHPELWEE